MRLLVCSIAIAAFAIGCQKKDDSSTTLSQQLAQDVGDVMASIDEGSGGKANGSFTLNEFKAAEKMIARYVPQKNLNKQFAVRTVIPRAEAAACYNTGWGSCSANALTRTFNNCQIGNATLNGTVALSFGGGAASCSVSAAGHHVSRIPNFTLTGLYGGTLAVNHTGTFGQRLEYVSGAGSSAVFNFSNDGIRRKISFGSIVYNDSITTTVNGPLTITGVQRNGRTLTSTGGAALRVTNNETGKTCDFTPSAVTWSSNCSCATSGSWSASCSDSESATLTITSCGAGTFTSGTESTSVTFDRCTSI